MSPSVQIMLTQKQTRQVLGQPRIYVSLQKYINRNRQ